MGTIVLTYKVRTMPVIKVKHIVSFSSEDKKFPAENLLKPEGTCKWKSASTGEKSVSAILQLEKATEIHQIDIGNEGSAFIEVLVGRSSQTEEDYKVLLVASSFMDPKESRSSSNPTRVRIFSSDKLSQTAFKEKWDRVKIVCTQPFNKSTQYGLSFIKFHSAPDDSVPAQQKQTTLGGFRIREEADVGIKVGSLFAQRKESSEEPPLTGAAAVRAASKVGSPFLAVAPSTPSTTHSSRPSTPTNQVSRSSTPTSQASSSSSKSRDSEKSSTGHKHSHDSDKHKHKHSSHSHSSSKHSEKHSSHDSSNHKRKHSDDRKLNDHRKQTESSYKKEAEPPSKKSKSEDDSSIPQRPLGEVMKKVVFALSGFQNPRRSDLRDMTLEMGAKYRSDWDSSCTHLICAFTNTPKYQSVSGKGRIVSQDWVKECYRKKKLLPWRRFRLGNAPSPPGSDTEEKTESKHHIVSTNSQTDTNTGSPANENKSLTQLGNKTSSPNPPPTSYDSETEEDSDTDDEIQRIKAVQTKTLQPEAKKSCTDDPYNDSTDDEKDHNELNKISEGVGINIDELPPLPNFFKNKKFFMYGTFSAQERKRLHRYIVAYNGCVKDYMSEQVNCVLTHSNWDENFDKALTENVDLTFLRPDWVHKCHDSQTIIPYQKYIVSPS